MASPLCGTGLYANDVLCEIIDNLDTLMAAAQTANDNAQDAMGNLEDQTLLEIQTLGDINYSVNTDAVPKSYVPPTGPTEPDYASLSPTAPTVPTDAQTTLIDDTTIQDIYNQEADNLARISVKEERDAQYKASSMGIGMASAALTQRLNEAQEATNQRLQEIAQKKRCTINHNIRWSG